MVNWFWQLRSYIGDNDRPLIPSFVRSELSDQYPSGNECAILLAMDRAYRSALRETIDNYQAAKKGN